MKEEGGNATKGGRTQKAKITTKHLTLPQSKAKPNEDSASMLWNTRRLKPDSTI